MTWTWAGETGGSARAAAAATASLPHPHPTHPPCSIDIKVFTREQAAAALISWTGNTNLNRALRAYAGNLGLGLDDRGIGVIDTTVPTPPTSKSGWTSNFYSVTLPARSEFDIYSYLGLRFIPPQERSCFSTHFGL